MRLTNVAKKALMAGSGLVLTAYVFAHLAGNLLFFAGPTAIDDYAVFLRERPALLWPARVILLAAVLIHIVTALDLYAQKSAARGEGYAYYRRITSSLGARSMLVTGIALLPFIVYHILHLTIGAVHPAFVEGAVFQNIVLGFARAPAAIFYAVVMVALSFHLSHGIFSMTQSLGAALSRPGLQVLRRVSLVLAVLLGVGFASIPITALYLAFFVRR